MTHPDREVQAALTRLLDALCTWERETGRESVLVLREAGGGFVCRAQSGKPGIPDDIEDEMLLRSIDTIPRQGLSPADLLASANSFAFSALPEGHPARHYFTITAAYRGAGGWSVGHLGDILANDGHWSWEIQPSARDETWLSAHRFDRDEAIRLALEWAQKITFEGKTAADMLARRAAPRRSG